MQKQKKACTKCGEIKPYEAFAIQRETKTGRQSWCRECTNEGVLWASMFRKFGLTQEQYEAMAAFQGNKCAACRKPETIKKKYGSGVRRLAVDHCAKTGKIRGLLCSRCNRCLGALRDDPKLIRRLYKYALATCVIETEV